MNLSQDPVVPSSPTERLEWRIGVHDRYRTNPREWYRWVFDHIGAPKDARILDAGCGTARLWDVNKDRIPASWHTYLCDVSPAMADRVHRSLPPLPCSSAVLATDSSRFPFPEGTLDAILAMHVLHHVEDADKALKWFGRLLKRDGILYVTAGSLDRLKNIDAIGTSCCPQLKLVAEDPKKRFSAETGAAILKRHFRYVRSWAYPDSIVFDDFDTFVEYVRSLEGISSAAFDDPTFAVFGQFVRNMLQSDGHVTLCNDAAMFEARS